MRGTIREYVIDGSRTTGVIVELADGARATLPIDLLRHGNEDAYVIPARWQYFVSNAGHQVSIPVVAEQPTVEIRQRALEQLRVRRRVVSEQQVVETPVWRQRIEVQHVPIDVYVDQWPQPRQEGDTLVVPVVEEEVTVIKRLRVREELRVRLVNEQHVDRQTVTLRRHEIDLEREAPSADGETAQQIPPSLKH